MLTEQQYNNSITTSIGLTDELLLIGNSAGELWMYDRESEEHYAVLSEKSKDFFDNTVTCIDVHEIRPEYAVLGFKKG